MDNGLSHLMFPVVQAQSLAGRAYHVPGDLPGEHTMLILMFQRWQQHLAASWCSHLEPLMIDGHAFCTYTLLVRSNVYTLARPFIDGSPPACALDAVALDHTLTIYTDVRQMMASLQIASAMTITVLLIDRSGAIRGRGQGGYDHGQAATLKRALGSTYSNV